MPNNRVHMRQIRESLRLHLQAGLSYNKVGRALKISKSAVGQYISLARVAGIDWDIAQTLTDDELQARLYRPALPRSSQQLEPDFGLIHQELKRAGVTGSASYGRFVSLSTQQIVAPSSRCAPTHRPPRHTH